MGLSRQSELLDFCIVQEENMTDIKSLVKPRCYFSLKRNTVNPERAVKSLALSRNSERTQTPFFILFHFENVWNNASVFFFKWKSGVRNFLILIERQWLDMHLWSGTEASLKTYGCFVSVASFTTCLERIIDSATNQRIKFWCSVTLTQGSTLNVSRLLLSFLTTLGWEIKSLSFFFQMVICLFFS